MRKTSKKHACRNCLIIFEGNKCPNCGSTNYSDNFKGKVIILNYEKSYVAKQMNVKSNGLFAIDVK